MNPGGTKPISIITYLFCWNNIYFWSSTLSNSELYPNFIFIIVYPDYFLLQESRWDIRLQLICTASAAAVLLANKVFNTLYYAFAIGNLYLLLSFYLLLKCFSSENKRYLGLFVVSRQFVIFCASIYLSIILYYSNFSCVFITMSWQITLT